MPKTGSTKHLDGAQRHLQHRGRARSATVEPVCLWDRCPSTPVHAQYCITVRMTASSAKPPPWWLETRNPDRETVSVANPVLTTDVHGRQHPFERNRMSPSNKKEKKQCQDFQRLQNMFQSPSYVRHVSLACQAIYVGRWMQKAQDCRQTTSCKYPVWHCRR